MDPGWGDVEALGAAGGGAGSERCARGVNTGGGAALASGGSESGPGQVEGPEEGPEAL